MRPIQSPPDELQNLVKVPWLPRRRRHSRRQRRIQMRVTVHQTRHQYGTATINGLVTRRGNNVCSDYDNTPIGHAQIARLDQRRIKLNEQRIAKKSRHSENITLCDCQSWFNTPVRSLNAFNLPIPFVGLSKRSLPEFWIPQFAQFIGRAALLLDPREVFEIVKRLAIEIRQFAQMVGHDSIEITGLIVHRPLVGIRAVLRPLSS